MYKTLDKITDQQQLTLASTEVNMMDRQIAVGDSYAAVDDRVKNMIATDPRKDDAESLLGAAKSAKNAFVGADASTYINPDTLQPTADFNNLEKDAINAINAVNMALIAPTKPGNVPQVDLTQDLIPWVVKILFSFASLAILVSFIVSGVMFIVGMGEEARITSAKHILYYSLIGFAFITLAYAIVKAITHIDFFGIV